MRAHNFSQRTSAISWKLTAKSFGSNRMKWSTSSVEANPLPVPVRILRNRALQKGACMRRWHTVLIVVKHCERAHNRLLLLLDAGGHMNIGNKQYSIALSDQCTKLQRAFKLNEMLQTSAGSSRRWRGDSQTAPRYTDDVHNSTLEISQLSVCFENGSVLYF